MSTSFQGLFSEMDKAVFQDRVSETIQRDGQRVLDAACSGDTGRLMALAKKYERDAGLSQGGGGAGPGKVKTPRLGAPAVYRLALHAVERLTA